MNDEAEQPANAFFALEETFKNFPEKPAGQALSHAFCPGGKVSAELAAEKIQSILELYSQAEKDLLAANLEPNLMNEHWSLLRGNRKSFLAGLTCAKDTEFYQRFRPRDKAAMIRMVGQLVEQTTPGSGASALDRVQMAEDLHSLLAILDAADLQEQVKFAMRQGLNCILAMSIFEDGLSDREIRSRIKELLADYVEACRASVSQDQSFSEKLSEFVAKHGVNTLGKIALINDATGSYQIISSFLS